jgi:hypothetical protein
MEKQLLSVSAFYRNDQPDGIGVSISAELFQPGKLEEIINQLFKDSDADWINHSYEENLDHYFGQLRALVKDKGKMKKPIKEIGDAVLVISCVYSLEQHGPLQSDEFNGIQLIYVQ